MSEKDFQKEIKKITTQAIHERKQELAQEKARELEARMTAKKESRVSSKQREKGNTLYTAVIIAKLEYKGDKIPSREQLAEDLGRNIMKWVNQKGFYTIDPQEPVPELVSVDVDVV